MEGEVIDSPFLCRPEGRKAILKLCEAFSPARRASPGRGRLASGFAWFWTVRTGEAHDEGRGGSIAGRAACSVRVIVIPVLCLMGEIRETGLNPLVAWL